MAEVFLNVAESTLSVAATNVATTLTLASGAPFNVAGQYRLRLDDSLQQVNGVATRYEICRATFNAGNVVNAFRSGADLEGTTAQAWPIGTKVVAIVTAAGLNAFISAGPPKAAAYQSGAQNVAGGTTALLNLNSIEFDTGSNFDAVTNHRFTAPTTGYYQVNWAATVTLQNAVQTWIALLFKVNVQIKNGSQVTIRGGTGGDFMTSTGSAIIQMNALDFIDMHGQNAGGGNAVPVQLGAPNTYMSVALIGV